MIFVSVEHCVKYQKTGMAAQIVFALETLKTINIHEGNPQIV